ncbi:MAG: dodecin [Fibrobacterota bacterium]
MEDHIYKTIELVGSSKESQETAIKNAVILASETVKNMRWFEVIGTRGYIEDNEIAYWQVTIKIGFSIDK